MNFFKLILIALLLPCITYAQTIKEGKAKIGKMKGWAFTATYHHTKDVTINAIEANIANAKLVRTSKKKGYSAYKNADWQTISTSKADYYYRAKGKRGETMVTFAAVKPDGTFVATTNDPQTAANIVVWLQNLEKQITSGKIEKSEPNKPGGTPATMLQPDAQNDAKIQENKKLEMLRNTQHPPLPVK